MLAQWFTHYATAVENLDNPHVAYQNFFNIFFETYGKYFLKVKIKIKAKATQYRG